MRLIIRCLLTLLAATSMCRASNWYAAPNGSGNGTLASPWSLQTAITSSSIKPGDTVWLLGGTYFPTSTYPDGNVNRQGWKPTISGNSSQIITFASYSNQWAAVDREWDLKNGGPNYLCFSNLEFYDSLKGHNLTNTDSAGNPPWNHFSMGGQTGFQWVNCVIHDVHNCFSSGAAATSIRGNIIWYVGWNILEHVCYPAPASFSGNICAWHMENVINFNTEDLVCTSNIIFGGGNTTPNPLNPNSDIVGGGYNETIAWNYFYNRLTNAVTSEVLNMQSSPAGTMTINNNVLVGPVPSAFAGNGNTYGAVKVQNNTFYASSSAYSGSEICWCATNGSWTLNNNNYYSTAPNPVAFYIQGTYGNSLSQWQSKEGFDLNSTASCGTTPPYAVYVVPNQDQPKRANIAVYNWPKSNNVIVSLSGVLNAGDSYSLYSAQNLNGGVIQNGTFGGSSINYSMGWTPIQTGTYNGAGISVPMTNLTVAPMLYGTNQNSDGVQIVLPPPTSPEFGAFIVVGSASSGANPTPVVTWPTPAGATYGTLLSSSQLNATANMPGSFAYTPSAGAVLNAGTNTLSVVFTPSNGAGAVTNTVKWVVSPASLSVIVNNATRQFGLANPVFTGTITGLRNGDNITAAYSCSATLASPSGTYPIVPSFVDPNNRLANYIVTLTNGTLTISMVAPQPPTGFRIMPQA